MGGHSQIPAASLNLVVATAHPDDEAWAHGALIAAAADAGWAVTVLCATRGEAAGDDPDLPRVREGELADSCAVLGADHRVVGLPDGRVAAHEAAFADALAQLPADLVATIGPDGGYGHEDHLAVTRAVRRDPRPRLLGAFPRGHFHPLARSLRRARKAPIPAGWGPDRFGVQAPDLALRPGLRKARAVACHRSQGMRGPLLGAATPWVLAHEWYVFDGPRPRALPQEWGAPRGLRTPALPEDP